jgi:hypothetical protein
MQSSLDVPRLAPYLRRPNISRTDLDCQAAGYSCRTLLGEWSGEERYRSAFEDAFEFGRRHTDIGGMRS